MKKILKILALVLVVALAAAFGYIYQAAPVGTGYTSKYICSHVFTSGQDPDEAMEVFIKPINKLFEFITYEVDYNNKEVHSTLFGFLRPMTAIYRDGCGCTLMVDVEKEDLLKQVENLTLPPPILPDTIWPIGNRVEPDKGPVNVDLPALNQVLQKQFVEGSDDPHKMINTMAIAVAYKDQIIAEQYREGVTDSTPLLSWSASKSITGTLIGTLVKNEDLDIFSTVPIDDWQTDDRKDITIDQLLRMESGLAFEEVYAPMTDVVEMLYESQAMGAQAATQPLEAKPGAYWKYSSGTTNILAKIIFEQVGGDLASLEAYAHETLFHKLGMTTVRFEHDVSGAYVGSSYFYASVKDWLRFCLLYKNDGVWNGERILPEGWVEYTLTPTPHAPQGKYGAQIWLNAGDPENPENRMFPRLPRDAYLFNGYQDQCFMVIPSKDLMIARMGVTNNDNWSFENLVLEILETIDYAKEEQGLTEM